MEVAFQFRPPAPRNHNPPLTVRTALCAGKPPHDGLAADNSPSGMRKLRMKPRLRNGRRMPSLLFSPIGEALVFVREAQHLVFGQPVMHLVPEGADFPGSITPTLLLAVVGLHSANLTRNQSGIL